MPSHGPAIRQQPIRDAILAFLTEPRSARSIAAHVDRTMPTAAGHLAALLRCGLVVRLAHGVYAVAGYAGPPIEPAPRPQPIRDAILAFLTEPRAARAVAAHIGRPVPTATGHLAAMRRRGLVVRLGFAAYARADYTGPPLEFCETGRFASRQPRPPTKDAILAFLTEPRSAGAIAAHIDRPIGAARGLLAAMRRRGVVVRIGYATYARADYTGPPLAAPVWPRPTKDAIFAFLAEPRSVRAIAAHIDRPVPTATWHLATMRREGLVVRLHHGAYARADYTGPPVEFRRAGLAAAGSFNGMPGPCPVRKVPR